MKNSRIRSVAKILVGNFTVSGFGFMTSILLARWLGPAKQGTLSLLLVYPLLSQQLSDMGIRQAAARSIGQKLGNLGRIVSTVLWIWLFTSIFGFFLSWGLLSLENPSGTDPLDALLAAMLLPFLCFQSYAGGILIGCKRIASFMGTRWIPSSLQFFLVGIGWVAFPPRTTWALVIRWLALLLAAFSAFTLVRKAIPGPWGKPDLQLARNLISEGFSYGTAMAIVVLNYRLGILTLEWWSTPLEIGYYVVAQQNAEILWQLPAGFGVWVFANSLSERDQALASVQAKETLRQAMWSSGVCALFALILCRWALPWIYGAEYYPSVGSFIVFIPGVLAMVPFKVARFDLVGQGKPWRGLGSVVLGAIVNPLVGYCLVPRFGAIGAAFSTSLAYVLTGIGFLWVYFRNHEV